MARRQPRPELLVNNLPADARATLLRNGYEVRSERVSALIGGTVTRLQAPSGTSSQAALQRLRALAPGSIVARNDMFRRLALSFKPAGAGCGAVCEPFRLTSWTNQIGQCSAGVRLGVIDTGVDTKHPSLMSAKLVTKTVRSTDHKASDLDHGTAVVSLLIGQSGSNVQGLAPSAHVFAADAFHGTSSGSSADSFDLIAGLDWLVEQNVLAINLSLSGPDNAFIKLAVAKVIDRKVAVIAAAGKPTEDGDKTGFPARYPGVVAVSAVDARLRPSRLSIRGSHISFAAPGVGINVANAGNQLKLADGTSFAAPFVTAAYAGLSKTASTTQAATDVLAAAAKDLGSPGRDPIYGWGLIQYEGLPVCR